VAGAGLAEGEAPVERLAEGERVTEPDTSATLELVAVTVTTGAVLSDAPVARLADAAGVGLAVSSGVLLAEAPLLSVAVALELRVGVALAVTD